MKTFFAVLRNRSWLFLWLGIITILLRFVAEFFPNVVEQAYSRGLFPLLRNVIDYTIGWCPFPFSYLVILGLLIFWMRKFIRNRKLPKQSWKGRLKLAGTNLLGFVGALTFFFYLLWGFNYQRVPIEKQLGLRLDSLSIEALCLEADWAARSAEIDRAAIPAITDDSISWDLFPENLESEVRVCVGKTMSLMGFPATGRIRGRMIEPGGWMLWIGISGIYNPFTGEGNVSGAQTPPKIPFTMAHEMAHACGFGDEGTCNFIGLVACTQSENAFIRYSGQMGYWGHLANEIAEVDPLLYKMLLKNLAPGIKADLRASYNNYQKYHGTISKMGNRVNNAYLKLQGVKEGVKSYDRVVVLRAAWRKMRNEQ